MRIDDDLQLFDAVGAVGGEGWGFLRSRPGASGLRRGHTEGMGLASSNSLDRLPLSGYDRSSHFTVARDTCHEYCLPGVNGQCELRTGGQVSSGSADTKSPGLRTVSASPPGADSVNAGQAAPVRAAVTATVVYRIVKLPPTASMAAPPRCPSSPRPPTPNATPSNYSAPPSH